MGILTILIHVRQGLPHKPKRRVTKVEAVQLTECSAHIGSLEWWQSFAHRKQHNAEVSYWCNVAGTS